MNKFLKLFIVLFIFFLGLGGGYFISLRQKNPQQPNKNPHVLFTLEVYDTIKQNYWDKITDEQLVNLYKLALEKLLNQPQTLKSNDIEALEKLITVNMQNMDSAKKKDFSANLNDIVLANLQPLGRSRLYSKKQETDLSNNVKNINPNVDQYQTLGLDKTASGESIAQAFRQKSEALSQTAESSPAAKQKLEEVKKAYTTLSDQASKQIYDQSGVEPTIDWQIINDDIFYLHINKFSPTTFDELARVLAKTDTYPNMTTLIFDLQNNIGGAIDGLPYFLGPFIGPDQYAYQFLHQGIKEDYKTKVGWLPSLVKFKKVVILINNETQSTAEVMAASLKRYNTGVLVGTTTKGWGTIEKVLTLENQIDKTETYSVFLVHTLTLREDGQPIEGNGVEPAVNVKDANWTTQLTNFFNYPLLVQTVKEKIVNIPVNPS